MSTVRFQAKPNQLTQERLEQVREALGLETSEKAVLLDEITRIAFWAVRQSMEGRTIHAVQDDEGEPHVLEHAGLAKLRDSVHLQLSRDEASALATLLAESTLPNASLRRTLDELKSLGKPFTLEWADEEGE